MSGPLKGHHRRQSPPDPTHRPRTPLEDRGSSQCLASRLNRQRNPRVALSISCTAYPDLLRGRPADGRRQALDELVRQRPAGCRGKAPCPGPPPSWRTDCGEAGAGATSSRCSSRLFPVTGLRGSVDSPGQARPCGRARTGSPPTAGDKLWTSLPAKGRLAAGGGPRARGRPLHGERAAVRPGQERPLRGAPPGCSW